MKTFAIVIAAALLLAACGGRSASPPAAPPPSPAAEQGVTLKLTEFKFEPASVEVQAGKVAFELQNAGTVEHNFVIVGTNYRVEAIPPGEDGSLEATLQPGTYQVECDVPGHKEAGMIMTLVVK